MARNTEHQLIFNITAFAKACSLARFLVLVLVFSQNPDLSAQVRSEAKSRAKLDVVLMFDASGSMLKTDPNELRYEGAKLLLSFLAEGDRLGVVQFAGDAKVVQGLEPFVVSRSEQVMQRIRGIPTEGAFTDITEGIKVSAAMLDQDPQPDAQRVVVVLSDGKVEPDPAVGPALARTLQLVQDMLPELKTREIKVFTLALSEQADRALLGEVSAATDGLTWYTQTADDMHRSFAQLFLALKRPQVVPQNGRGFSIDSDVSEATFYINHQQGSILSLVSPKGEVMTADKHPEFVTWFSGQNFDVITVTEPDLGEWSVSGAVAEDGFATLLTDLKLLTDWPLVVRAGDEPLVQARLYEENKPVVLPEMSGVVKFGFQIVPTDKISKPIVQEPLSDDGTRGDVVALDGIFSARIGALATGAYKLTVVAKGPTFQRTQQIPFTVKPRLVSLHVRSPEDAFVDDLQTKSEDETQRAGEAEPGEQASSGYIGAEYAKRIRSYRGSDSTEFTVSLSKEALALKGFEVKLNALSEDRRVTELPLRRVAPTGHEFVAKAEALRSSGRYLIKAIFSGRDKKGELIEAESSSVQFVFAAGVRKDSGTLPKDHGGSEDIDQDRSTGYRVSFPIVPLGIISVINLVVFLVAQRFFKRNQGAKSEVGQRYLPPAELIKALEVLEGRAASTEVVSDDPIFALIESLNRAGQLTSNTASDGASEAQIAEELA
jgi:hypothetical protein